MLEAVVTPQSGIAEPTERNRRRKHIRLTRVGRVPTADLSRPFQPVPYGVRMHTQRAGGRIQRCDGVEENAHGLERRIIGIVAFERLID